MSNALEVADANVDDRHMAGFSTVGAPQPINVVYLVVREGMSSVFDAQVLKPLSKQQGHVTLQLVIFDQLGHWLRRAGRRNIRRIGRRAEAMRVAVTRLPSAPSRSPGLWNDSHLLRLLLLGRLDRNARFILHCRGSKATLAGLEMRRWFTRATVVFDCRSAAPAAVRQHYERLGKANSDEAIAEIDREEVSERLATGADHVLCLSHHMAEYLVSKYRLPPDRLTVVPCCADYDAAAMAACERSAARRELQIDGRLAVAYCGELEWYQLPELSLRIFQAIRLLHRDAHFLAITPSADKMRQLCERSSLEPGTYTVLSVDPELVPRYLAAADLGLLPRAPGLDSRVSSPIKFGEYLACGLPVVASDGIGDVSGLIRGAKLGVVLNHDAARCDVPTLAARLAGFVDSYRRDAATWRQRCQRVARTELDWATHLPNVLSLYQRLNTMR